MFISFHPAVRRSGLCYFGNICSSRDLLRSRKNEDVELTSNNIQLRRNNFIKQHSKLRNFAAPNSDDSFLSSISSHDSPHTIHYTMHDGIADITVQDAILQANSQQKNNEENTNFSSIAMEIMRNENGSTKEFLTGSHDSTSDVTLLNYNNPSSPYCQQVGIDFPSTLKSFYTPMQLLSLGSVWYLSAAVNNNDTYNTASIKPVRLNRSDCGKLLQTGDCLRIHYIPRRFLTLHEYDFAATAAQSCNKKTGVILHEDFEMGFTVINKPPNVPVHMTVDNVVENVATAYGRGLLGRMRQSGKNIPATSTDMDIKRDTDNQEQKQYLRDSYFNVRQTNRSMRRNREGSPPQLSLELLKETSPLVYVTTPQRLDQNTTGLFVISTAKAFSGYFAKILRKKTSYQLQLHGTNNATTIQNKSNDTSGRNLVHKTYKCLVCIQAEKQQSSSFSLKQEIKKLEAFVQNKTILTHYLEPSIRAPKFFSPYQKDSSWAECLLRITAINNKSILFVNDGTKKSSHLALQLWGSVDAVPRKCIAVAELEIELLTGRTHQIRGQLAAEGYPLVGDAQYGGVLVRPFSSDQEQDQLALQCCELSFALPKFVQVENSKKRDEMMGVPTDQWIKFRLDEAWWTKHIKSYYKEENDTINDWQEPA